MTLPARFWTKVNKTDSCWIWTAGFYGGGYGAFRLNKQSVNCAHRIAYEDAHGPIADGLDLDHVVCQNKACVNPAHMEPVTPNENTRRNAVRGVGAAAYQRAKTHCPHGHEYTGNNVLFDKLNRRYCRTCANERKRMEYHQRVNGNYSRPESTS
jgi:hypothetical protein